MPYVLPNHRERALTNAERDRRLSKIEAEQAKLLPDVHSVPETPEKALSATRLDVNRKGITESLLQKYGREIEKSWKAVN